MRLAFILRVGGRSLIHSSVSGHYLRLPILLAVSSNKFVFRNKSHHNPSFEYSIAQAACSALDGVSFDLPYKHRLGSTGKEARVVSYRARC